MSSIENKTVRPGSMLGYSYYRSARRPVAPAKRPKTSRRQGRSGGRWALLAIVLALAAGWLAYSTSAKGTPPAATTTAHHSTTVKSAATTPAPKPATPAPAVTAPATTPCTGNTLSQLVIVSISQRHLWACQAGQSLYDSPVVTGIDYLAADTTPTGTYHIYARETDVYLRGHDSTGSWDDYVYYWMPFLQNQYGSYGLHDATWRSASDFGNISPNSSDASHGCVELPLTTAKWLYDWVQIGTAVTIES